MAVGWVAPQGRGCALAGLHRQGYTAHAKQPTRQTGCADVALKSRNHQTTRHRGVSIGGVSIGGVSIGGVSIGGVSIGGVSIGGVSIGGHLYKR